MIILFGGKEYAVGLTWFSVSSPSEIDQFKREMDMTLGVMKISKEEGEPSCVALAPSEYANQVSLAAALSYAHSNLIYACKTEYKDEAGRQLYYLCCVKRGAVTVEGDTIADVDTIQSLYAQSLMDLRTDIPEDSIECFGTDVGDDRFESAQPIDASHLVTSIQRFESQCVIKELKKEGTSKAKMVTLGVLVLGTLLLGYQLFKPEPPPPPPPAPVAAPVARAPAPVDPFTQLVNSMQLQKTLSPAALLVMMNALKTIPMQISGWKISEITVNIGETSTFSLQLVRMPFATVDGLRSLEKAGTLKNVSFAQSGDEARAVWGTDLKDTPLLTKASLEVLKNEKAAQFQTAFMSKMQSEAMVILLEAPTNVAGYSVQKFSYKNQGLWSIGGFAEVFQDMITMGITSLHIKPADGNYEWELQGVIYG